MAVSLGYIGIHNILLYADQLGYIEYMLSVTTSPATPPNPVMVSGTSGFATTVEAARFLQLSKGMVHKLIGEGEIPVRRFGRSVRIPWSWLAAQADGKNAA